MGRMTWNRISLALEMSMLALAWAREATGPDSDEGKEISQEEAKGLVRQVLTLFNLSLDDIV